MGVVGRKPRRGVQGRCSGILTIVHGTNQMFVFVHISPGDITYAEQLRMKLGNIGERQKCHPRIVALHFMAAHGHWHRQPQHFRVGAITGMKPYTAEQSMSRLVNLAGGSIGAARLAYSVIEH